MTLNTKVDAGSVRVRFAPSPTGYLHIGGARTTLFNWLYAKHTGGTFILRVEDTDQERSTPEAERMQIEDIKWLGLHYEEGPDVGGPHSPYRQSERREIYAKLGKDLMDRKLAYHCFCSDELLDQKREAALKLGQVPQYDGTCRDLTEHEVQSRLSKGEKALVRFRAPVRTYVLHDAVRGEVVFQENMVGDFVVLRSDGMPVYNFCCVVDDHLMGITHVIRAEEHLSNTVRQMMLYEAFSWPLPTFAHCSLILGSDRSKLSKRHGATSVHQYAEEGYLPEAILNFLVLLGWSSPEGMEIMPMETLIKQFDLDRLNKAPSVFDPQKLKWMNGQYIRAMEIGEIFQRAYPFIEKAGFDLSGRSKEWLQRAFDSIRGNLEVLSDVGRFLHIYFDDKLVWEADAEALRGEEHFKTIVGALKAGFEDHLAAKGDAITAEEFLALQESVKVKTGLKGKNLFMPLRVALTRQTHGPELRLVVPLLGAKACLKRVESSLISS